VGEANTFVTLLTPDLGLVQAQAQSLRKSGAKLAYSLTTLAESDVVLVRGKDGWRLAGAVLEENWFQKLQRPETRAAAARVSGLFLRLVAGEAQDVQLFILARAFISSLAELPADMHELAEILVVLRLLATLGLDSGDIPGDIQDFTPSVLSAVLDDRKTYIARINTGISASGL